MGDDPARERVERIVFDHQQTAAECKPRGEILDRGAPLLRHDVVHHIGEHDQAVIAVQLIEPAREHAMLAQRRLDLIQTV